MRWTKLTIYTSEGVRWQHRTLYIELVEQAKKAGISGTFVARGIEGYGAHHKVQTTNILALATDLPIEIKIIEQEDVITNFLPLVKKMVREGVVILEDVKMIYYPE